MRNSHYVPHLKHSYSQRDREAVAQIDSEIVRVYGDRAVRRGSARAARAPGAANLEIATLEDCSSTAPGDTQQDFALRDGVFREPDVWNVAVTEYRSGIVEVRAYMGAISHSVASERVAEVKDDVLRFDCSIKRSKRILRSRCLQLDADHMITLTKRGKFASADAAWHAFSRFNRLMKKRFRGRWEYVAVPELHSDRETWHIHVAVKGFYMVDAVRLVWQRALGGRGNERGADSLGNVQMKFFKHRRGRHRASDVAHYIAKYVGKGFGADRRGRRLFASSENLKPDRAYTKHIRHWHGSMRDVVFAVCRGLEAEGIFKLDGCTNVYFWSRHKAGSSSGVRPDEEVLPWMEGFMFSVVRDKS